RPRVRIRFFFQAEDGIRDFHVTGVQTCALPISGVHAEEHPLAVGDDVEQAPRTVDVSQLDQRSVEERHCSTSPQSSRPSSAGAGAGAAGDGPCAPNTAASTRCCQSSRRRPSSSRAYRTMRWYAVAVACCTAIISSAGEALERFSLSPETLSFTPGPTLPVHFVDLFVALAEPGLDLAWTSKHVHLDAQRAD